MHEKQPEERNTRYDERAISTSVHKSFQSVKASAYCPTNMYHHLEGPHLSGEPDILSPCLRTELVSEKSQLVKDMDPSEAHSRDNHESSSTYTDGSKATVPVHEVENDLSSGNYVADTDNGNPKDMISHGCALGTKALVPDLEARGLWTPGELVILVRTAEQRIPWADTMILLPNRSRDTARRMLGVLKDNKTISIPLRRFNHAEVPQKDIDEILREAAHFDKIAYCMQYGEIARENPNGVERQLDPNKRRARGMLSLWTMEEDEQLLRMYVYDCKGVKEIVKALPRKSLAMCKSRITYHAMGVPEAVRYTGPTVAYQRWIKKKMISRPDGKEDLL
ncbi:hypothetical protein BS50DRAFT_649952 [Corynespora cassiicola Philippines]|uniref:Myb-like domain-containing protein n=1 Tax=Corynespora cassiicola Philippines TaxID=1448308 RepID=A0A2T2NBA8_CORCC|nr:hypothetical protein BS50DRAFT_649952 [Corynespora cassiicola Philippines]